MEQQTAEQKKEISNERSSKIWMLIGCIIYVALAIVGMIIGVLTTFGPNPTWDEMIIKYFLGSSLAITGVFMEIWIIQDWRDRNDM